MGGVIIFPTVEYLFPYSQCLYFSQLSVELKSPLSEFCALSLNLSIYLLKLVIHLHLPMYMGNTVHFIRVMAPQICYFIVPSVLAILSAAFQFQHLSLAVECL